MRFNIVLFNTGETIPQHMFDVSSYKEDLTDLNAGGESSYCNGACTADIKPLLPVEEVILPSHVLHHSVKEFEPFISTMIQVNPAETER